MRLQLLLHRLPALVQAFPATNPEERVCEISVTPDGKFALIPDNAKAFSIVHTESGKLTEFQVPPRTEAITTALLDNEGRTVWVKEANGDVYHINAEREVPIFVGFDSTSSEIGRSPCGRFIHVISKYRNAMTLFHANNGEVIKQIDSRRMGIFRVLYSRDVPRVAVTKSESIEIFDLPEGRSFRSIETNDYDAYGLLSDDGNEIIYCEDLSGFLVDLSGQSNDVKDIQFEIKPQFIFRSGDQRELITVQTEGVYRWGLEAENGIKNRRTEFIEALEDVLVRTADDSLLLNCGTHIMKRDKFGDLTWLAPLPFPARTAEIDTQSRLLVVQDERNNVLVWNLAIERVPPTPLPNPRVKEVDSQFLMVTDEKGTSAASLIPFANRKSDVDWHWSPQRKLLCMVDRYVPMLGCLFDLESTGGMRIWNVETGKPVGEKLKWGQHLSSINSDSPAFSPDGNYIACDGTDHDGNSVVLVWDIKKSSASILGSPLPGDPTKIAFSSDGQAIVAFSDDFLTVKSFPDGRTLGNFQAPGVYAVAASQGGKRVAVLHRGYGFFERVSGDVERVTIYDVESGFALATAPIPDLDMRQPNFSMRSKHFAFTNNDEYIVSYNSDGMGIWQVEPLAFLGFHFRKKSEVALYEEDWFGQGQPSGWQFKIPSELSLALADAETLIATQSGLGLKNDSRAQRLELPLLTGERLKFSSQAAPHLFMESSSVAEEPNELTNDWWAKFQDGDYEAVVKVRPECQPAWLALAYDHHDNKRWAESAEAFLQSDRLFPDFLQQDYYRANESFCRSGRFSDALAMAKREFTNPHPMTDKNLNYWLTRAHVGLGEMDEALSVLRRIVDSEDSFEKSSFDDTFLGRNDTDAVARSVLGLWQFVKGDPSAAEKTLTEAIAEEQFRDRAFAARAAMKMELKDWAAAMGDLTTAIKTQPDNSHYRLKRVACAVETKNWDSAIADIQHLQMIFPSELSHWSWLAEISALREDLKDREVSCRELISRFGSSSKAATRDAAIWECLQRPCVLPPGELVDLAEKLHESDSANSLYTETLILANYRAQQLEEVVKNFATISDPEERLVVALYAALARVRMMDSPENRKLATTALDKLIPSLGQKNWRQRLNANRFLSDAAELSIVPTTNP